jgi:hypothetical protein
MMEYISLFIGAGIIYRPLIIMTDKATVANISNSCLVCQLECMDNTIMRRDT